MFNSDIIIIIDSNQANKGLFWCMGKIKKIIPVNSTDHNIFHPLWYVINPNLPFKYSTDKYIPTHNKNHKKRLFHPAGNLPR